MATSIAFGELFATVVVLYLVPVTYSLYWSAGGRFAVDLDAIESKDSPLDSPLDSPADSDPPPSAVPATV